MPKKPANFNTDFSFSNSPEVTQMWEETYKKYFPGFVQTMRITQACPGSIQLGHDCLIYLASGKTVAIDEKTLRKNYKEFALEYCSNSRKKTPGWVEKDLQIDYLAYGFLPSKRCFIFDWQNLKGFWRENKEKLMSEFKHVVVRNPSYNSKCLLVPQEYLIEQLAKRACVEV